MLRDYDEVRLMDGLYKLEVIKHHPKIMVLEMLNKRLRAIKRNVKRPILKSRVEVILRFLNGKLKSMGTSQPPIKESS
jgi:hypothetical protein